MTGNVLVGVIVIAIIGGLLLMVLGFWIVYIIIKIAVRDGVEEAIARLSPLQVTEAIPEAEYMKAARRK